MDRGVSLEMVRSAGCGEIKTLLEIPVKMWYTNYKKTEKELQYRIPAKGCKYSAALWRSGIQADPNRWWIETGIDWPDFNNYWTACAGRDCPKQRDCTERYTGKSGVAGCKLPHRWQHSNQYWNVRQPHGGRVRRRTSEFQRENYLLYLRFTFFSAVKGCAPVW